MGGLLELVRTGAMSVVIAILIMLVVILVTYFVVFVERNRLRTICKVLIFLFFGLLEYTAMQSTSCLEKHARLKS